MAALAYGTATVPRVDKIVGPGNAFVAEAKRRVFGQVGIDMIAGPSEILVIADGTTDPDWVAMDLFSQAEHDELAQSILLCPDADYVERVRASINRQIHDMPRAEVIRASLEGRGARDRGCVDAAVRVVAAILTGDERVHGVRRHVLPLQHLAVLGVELGDLDGLPVAQAVDAVALCLLVDLGVGGEALEKVEAAVRGAGGDGEGRRQCRRDEDPGDRTEPDEPEERAQQASWLVSCGGHSMQGYGNNL